ncbi:MAG TPA: nuclear transport factor 2 family protein [bacterium]
MLKAFAAAVEAGDGTKLASLFTEQGVYHDTFYGEFKGRAAIKEMLEERFYRDAEKFRWDFLQPVSDSKVGYAEWGFSYTSKMAHNKGKRVAFAGMSKFDLQGGLISHYGEMFQGGVAFVQLGVEPARMEKVFKRWTDAQLTQPILARHVKA